jgi:hypothetical protein
MLYNIQFWVGLPTKLVELIEMHLNETCSKVSIGKHWSDTYPIKNGLEQGDPLSVAFQHCFTVCNWEGPRKPRGTENE